MLQTMKIKTDHSKSKIRTRTLSLHGEKADRRHFSHDCIDQLDDPMR
jgi:hypothetical protein